MPNTTFTGEAEHFIEQLDSAVKVHIGWSHQLLRCAVLGDVPKVDLISEDAHNRCDFGRWFRSEREQFDAIDTTRAQHLEQQHQQMHDAARAICKGIIDSEAGNALLLETFENTQDQVISDLAYFKTEFIEHSARIDSLTGLPLRYGLEEQLERSRVQAARRGLKLVMVMLDADHFKRVNDIHGHAVGDLALKHIGELLRANSRADEPVFRVGGEEFIALLLVADRDAAAQMIERLLKGVRNSPLPLDDGTSLHLTMSAGVDEVAQGETLVDAMDRADHALYAAKAAGRDTWRWAGESTQ